MSGQNSKVSGLIKDAFVLFAITLIAGLILGYVYELTKGPIAEVLDKAKTEAYQSAYSEAEVISVIDNTAVTDNIENSSTILADAGFSGTKINEVLEAKDSSDNIIGYVASITDNGGYGGDITISLGVDLEGAIKGIQILSMNETPGLGAKASEPGFLDQFIGKSGSELVVTTKGASFDNEIDGISGATITSNAVTKSVNAGIHFIENLVSGE